MVDTAPLELDRRDEHGHTSLRDHLRSVAGEQHPPVFEPSDDRALRAFAELFAETGLFALDVNRERFGQFFTRWHCSVISRSTADSAVEEYCVDWSPVGSGDDPRSGFGAGPDSAVLGHYGRGATPDDWRTKALLIVVTTPFLHLSASAETTPPLVQGALEAGLSDYRYVELMQTPG